MAKIRVYELAKKLGVGNKEILAELEEAGMAVKSHQADFITKKMGGEGVSLDDTDQAKAAPKKPSLKRYGLRRPAKPKKEKEKEEGGVKVAKRVAVEKKSQKGKGARRVLLKEGADVRMVAPSEQEPEEGALTVPEEGTAVSGKAAAEVAVEEAAPVKETPAEEAVPVAEPAPAEPGVKEKEPAVPAEEQTHPAGEPVAEAAPKKKGEIKLQPKLETASVDAMVEAELKKRIIHPTQQLEPQKPAEVKEEPAKKAKKGKKAKEELIEETPPLKGKKAKKGKRGRADIESIEGVERVPVISAKLKDRLQPVKKQKVGPSQEHVRPSAGKWPPAKGHGRKKGRDKQQKKQEAVEEMAPVVRKKAFKIIEGLTVKDFADKVGLKVGEVLKKLMELGMMATINQPMDTDAAELVADALDLKVEVVSIMDDEALVEDVKDKEEDLKPRPPVVTIMGHVDHGKTSLLDAIRETKVTDQEAGGITQHIGAYKVRLNEKDIVFLDTPGHEAFTAMRARGAQVTDIVVLVVAADDGVKPQTIEAINHSKAAGVPIIVAVNKIDKPEADQDRVLRELSDQGLVPEDWGGDTIFVAVSAKKRMNLDSLLEMILLQAEVMELKANPDKLGRGTIVEAKLDKGRGPVATVLVSSGTIRQGDVFVTGVYSGRIRMLLNDLGKKVDEAGPATPVEIIGLSGVPAAGDEFAVLEDERRARQVAQTRMQKQREAELASKKKVSLDDLFSQIQEGEVKELGIIIKADVQGSVEALSEALTKLSTDQVKLKVIHGSVGAVTESDVMLASASNAIIIGFNVRPEPKASALAENEDVDIRLYNIIYNAIEEVRAAMEGLLEPTFKEVVIGRAEVRQTFGVPKVGTIAGCYVTDGFIARNCKGVRVLRDNIVIYEGKLSSLKRFKDDVKEVQSGYECGLGVENYNDIKVGDVIEAYNVEETATKL